MRWTKRIFFLYLLFVGLMGLALAVSLAIVPRRDPHSLYTAIFDDIRTLDPAEIGDTLSSGVAGNIFECLYNYDIAFPPYRVVPELAAAMPRISPDLKTYTIRLRRGVHFHDPDRTVFPDGKGPQVTARDVIYSWKRIADFHLASPNVSFIAGKIKGIDAWTAYTKETPTDQIDWDRPVEGLIAVDDHTLRIELTEPYAQFLYVMAHLPTAVVSRAAVRHHGDRVRDHPIGTGAYGLRFADHLKQQRLVLHANPYYRGRPDVDGYTTVPPEQRLPRVARLQIDFFKEDLPAWFIFRQGLLDISGIPKDTFGQAISPASGGLTPEMRQEGIQLIKTPDPTTFYIGVNMDDPVLGKNKPLRHAIAMAIDRQRYITHYRNGRGQLPVGPIPPGFDSFDPAVDNPYVRYDLAAARRRLQEARALAGGALPRLTLLMPGTDTDARQGGDFLRGQLIALGLDMAPVEYANWARFLDIVEKKRSAQLFVLAWQADYPDEQNFFQLFYSRNIGEGGQNSTLYRSPDFDRLYDQAGLLPPGPQRTDLYRQMGRIIMEDCPWILMYYPVVFTLHQPWVSDLPVNDYLHGARKHVKLDDAQRRSRREGRR